MTVQGKLIVFTAPSGSGKTTIVRHILSTFPQTAFSVSATTRKKRSRETHAKDYYFLSVETFKSWISMDAFAEWEEVYEGQFYGTPKSEIDRLTECGKHVVFDVDVQGALSIKDLYPNETLAVFIKVPSLEEIEKRLLSRGHDDEESIKMRLAKAAHELTFESKFDVVLLNDNLQKTLKDEEDIVQKFLILG